MYNIFIVEDDSTIASLVRESLLKRGFGASCARDFTDVEGEFSTLSPDLVLLDISLPFHNGFYWCERLRRISKTPIVFLSSRSEGMDIVAAMNMGGDDYLTKPFSMDVLEAKINALLRRTYSYAAPQELAARGASLDTAAGALCCPAGRIELTKNELRILRTLIEKKDSIVPREEIMRALWDSESFVDDNTLTVNINRLRKKLDEAGLPDYISTKKGLVYMIHD